MLSAVHAPFPSHCPPEPPSSSSSSLSTSSRPSSSLNSRPICPAAAGDTSSCPAATFTYSRASPSIRWPHLQLEAPEESSPWLSLAREADLHALPYDECPQHDPFAPAAPAYSKPSPPPRSRWSASGTPSVADVTGLSREPRLSGKVIRRSKLSLKRAKDWRERVHRLAAAICSLSSQDRVADLMRDWPEQLNWTDMCFVLKRVGETNWQRALELYEWFNIKHWYRPNPRMLAGILSILGRAKQISLAKEIFDRGEPTAGNSVQVYNAMMGVYARQGNCDKVLELLAFMKEKGCDPDLITYNTVINARCKAGLRSGMAIELLKDMKRDRLRPDVITYNTLISACASRNDCIEAERIYVDMKMFGCEPDIWTYNAMISVYGRSGAEDAAKELFNIMQKKGFEPDAVTYNSILFAYAKSGKINDVDEVRMQMKKSGCKADEITYNTMISMYGKLGFPEIALSVYNEMRSDGCYPDAVTFTALIDALGRSGLVSEAEKVFKGMTDSGVQPSLQAFSAMICAYAKVGKCEQAQLTYDCMLQSGIVPDKLAFYVMVDMFQKADLPDKVFLVYQRATKLGCKPDIATYRILLLWLVKKGMSEEVEYISNDFLHTELDKLNACDTLVEAGLPDKAASLLKLAIAEGSTPNEILLSNIVSSYCTLGNFTGAQLFTRSLYSLLPHLAHAAHQVLMSTLIKCKQVLAAKEEFDDIRTGETPLGMDSYKSLLMAFHDAEMLIEVMQVFSAMQRFSVPLDDTCQKVAASAYYKLSTIDASHDGDAEPEWTLDLYVSKIEAYGKQRLWKKAEDTFKELQQSGYQPSVKAWNALIWAYANGAEYDNAKLAVHQMIRTGVLPTSSTCNAMLQAVTNAGRLKDLHSMLQEMRQYGVTPGKNVFLAVLESSANSGKVQLAKEVFQELKGAGYLPNMQVYRTLVLLFAQTRFVQDAEDMIKEMKADSFTPDIIIYNSMLTLYSKMGLYTKAAELFAAMQAAGCPPDLCTYNSLIWLYSKCSKVPEALGIVRQMEKAGFTLDVDSYTALISACGRLQMVEAAEVLFNDATQSGCALSSKLFHAMMNVFRKAGQPQQAKRILNQMQDAGVEPTLGTFHCLMDSYGKGGEAEKAEGVLTIMQEAGFKPGPLQYAGVINAYLKVNEHDQAIAKLFHMKDKGFEPNYIVWTSMVSAASRCRESCEAVKLLNALAHVGFSLPLRLLKDKSVAHLTELNDTLQELEAFGEDAGIGFVNVLLDLLWGFQMRAMTAKVFKIAIDKSIYSSGMARVQVRDWHADLKGLSAGAALVAITLWLDQMQDAALQGFPESPKFISLVTGCNKGANELSIEHTVKVYLWTMGSPFFKSKLSEGSFVAKGHSLRQWLKDSPHCQDLRLRNFTVLPELNTMQVYNGAFMQADLIPALKQIEENVDNLRPKKFSKLINLTDTKRENLISLELRCKKAREEKGKVTLKIRRHSRQRKRTGRRLSMYKVHARG